MGGKAEEALCIVRPFILEAALLAFAGLLLTSEEGVDVMFDAPLKLTRKYVFLIGPVVV